MCFQFELVRLAKSNWISFGWAKKQTGIEYFDKSNANCTCGWYELSLVYNFICSWLLDLLRLFLSRHWHQKLMGGFHKKSVIGVFIRCKLISFLWEVQISFLQVNAVQIWISQKCVCVRFHFCRILNVKMTLSLSQMQLYGVFLLNCYWRE